MNTDHKVWRRLTPDTIAELPEAAAVFEVANLVRSVQYIGVAKGNLRQRMASWTQEQAKLSPAPGGFYVRYEPASAEEQALEARLSTYRERHNGRLPTGNQNLPTAARLSPRPNATAA